MPHNSNTSTGNTSARARNGHHAKCSSKSKDRQGWVRGALIPNPRNRGGRYGNARR